jgi:hypothetical protein
MCGTAQKAILQSIISDRFLVLGRGAKTTVEPQQWYFVNIDHPRSARAVNTAVETLLVEEFIALGRPKNCRVYRKGDEFQGFSYFFSPRAAISFEVILRIWKGVGVSEPTNVHTMKVII